jgi:diadenosine tetraphosphate (Ap4A) HIT family hydrolase
VGDDVEGEDEMTCYTCDFTLFHVITELRCSTLGLYDDARFPGRCILSLRAHYDDLIDVPRTLVIEFFDDMRCAGAAIKAVTGADRINYAILGNAVSHVHAHLIPRVTGGDPVPNRAPWAHPDSVSHLATAQLDSLISSIRAELNT